MYALSQQSRRQEDSDEDDRPQAPVRNITGGGVAAAIQSARARHSPVQRHELGYQVEDSNQVNAPKGTGYGKTGILRPDTNTTIGAVAVPGISSSSRASAAADDENTTYQDSFTETPPEDGQEMPQMQGGEEPMQEEPFEAVRVADADADIEAQVNSRMAMEARDIAKLVHKELMTNAAVPVDVQSSVQDSASPSTQGQDRSASESQRKKRLCLIGIGLLAIVAAIAAGIGVAVSKGPDPPESCTFCFDGSTPSNLETNQILEDGQTCAEFRESQIKLDSSDPACTYGQAIAWGLCECPTLPPPPENPSCTMCEDGAIPSGDGCQDIDTFVAHLTEGPLTSSCDTIREGFVDLNCTCPSPGEIEEIEAFKSILQPLSGDKLNDASTPQYQTLSWIAYDDPANLPIDTSDDIIKTRYVAALLYYAFGGSNWKDQYNFLSEGDICTWNQQGLFGLMFGISCSSGGIVESVRLAENKLDGSIPEEIGYLSGLKIFDAANNTIDGTLPNSIESLTRLEYLNLTANVLSGTIPEFLYTHQHLTHLRLDYNHFKGTLSPSLGTSPNLALLWVRGSELTGTIPPSVGQSSVLENLNLRENQLTGTIPEFVSTSPIWNLWFASNGLVGSIPTSIGHLPSLFMFAVYDNSITGTIPSELGLCQNLRYLYLGENPQLVGTIPTELGQLRSLEDLWIDQAKIEGPIPTEFGGLSYLAQLVLYTNDLTGVIPTELGQCPKLNILDVGGNSLTGDIGQVIDSLPRGLKLLGVNSNQLQGTIPASIGSLTDISTIGASRNALSGSIPSEFGALSRLELLYLSSNQFGGSVPSELASLPLLVELRLEDNALTGGMDAFFCNNFELFSANTCSDPDDVECACCTHCCVPGTNTCNEL